MKTIFFYEKVSSIKMIITSWPGKPDIDNLIVMASY